MPDVVGYELQVSKEILRAHGFEICEIIETHPPNRKDVGGRARVVRQRLRCEGGVSLVVAFERCKWVGKER